MQHLRRRQLNQARYAAQNRHQTLAYLKVHPCVDCGEADPTVLDFDHVRESKAFNIANAITRLAWTRIVREIQKCEVRCANCHRRKTARENQWFKARFGA